MNTNAPAKPAESSPKRGIKLERITRKLAALDVEEQKRIAKRTELLVQLAIEKRNEASMSGRAEFLRALEELDSTKREAVISMVLEDLDDGARRDKIQTWEAHLAEDVSRTEAKKPSREVRLDAPNGVELAALSEMPPAETDEKDDVAKAES